MPLHAKYVRGLKVVPNSCYIGQRIISGTQFSSILVQPLLEQVWEDISLDFIEGLLRSRDKDCILIVNVDRLFKWAISYHCLTFTQLNKLHMYS